MNILVAQNVITIQKITYPSNVFNILFSPVQPFLFKPNQSNNLLETSNVRPSDAPLSSVSKRETAQTKFRGTLKHTRDAPVSLRIFQVAVAVTCAVQIFIHQFKCD